MTQWRAANENIAAFWAQLEHAFRVGGDVGSHITVEKDGDSRYVWLPSGRPIAYHGVKTRMVHRKGWNEPRELITFADPKRQFPFIDTYGGRLTENVTQAVARDLLAYGLVNLEENGSPAVGHVHDEVIVETRQEPLILGTVRRLFTTTPSWARGLPVDGEGFQCARYRK